MTKRELIFLKAAAQLYWHYPRNIRLPDEVGATLRSDPSPELFTEGDTAALISKLNQLIDEAR